MSTFNPLFSNNLTLKQLTFPFAITLSLLISGCERGSIIGGEDDWQVVAPEEYGLSTEALNTAADAVGNVKDRQCLTVIKNGTLIHESYYHGDQESRNVGMSVAKSFGATVIGIAETQGYLSIDDKVLDWVPDASEKINPEATIRHILGQVSESDPVGSSFRYDSATVINTLSDVLAAATEQNPVEFAYNELLEKIGIYHSSWGNDFNSPLPIGSGGHWTCRDLARLGQLYLNNGEWNGEQIISESFVEAATSASYPDTNSAYGYLWWHNKPGGKWYRPVSSGEGQLLADAPDSLYMATGALGQLIIVEPEQELVITTMGLTVELETLNTLKEIWEALAPALTPAP